MTDKGIKQPTSQVNSKPAAGMPSKKEEQGGKLNKNQKNSANTKDDTSQVNQSSLHPQNKNQNSETNISKSQTTQNSNNNQPLFQNVKSSNNDYHQGQQNFGNKEVEESKELQPFLEKKQDSNLICQCENIYFQKLDSQDQFNKIKEDSKFQSMQIRIDQSNSLEASVEEFLAQKIKDFQIETKKIIYQNSIKSLTPEDKQQRMKYIRLVDDIPLPQVTSPNQIKKTNIQHKQSIYMYEPPKNTIQRHWYINFADQMLFDYYQTSLFAQDEIQVSEHPLLAHVLEKIKIQKSKNPQLSPKTYEGLNPTPILITNCHRLSTVNTQGGKFYGNNFQRMTTQELQQNMKIFYESKTISNIICMAAMGYKHGYYTQDQIKFTLQTAFKSFYAARYITEGYNAAHSCVINTGNWGCGAFGNDSVFIALIQLIAAQLSGIDILVYHTYNKQGTDCFQQGKYLYEKYVLNMQQKNPNLQEIVEYIYKLKFQWGMSDGN
ncbi:hypothetical protein ABPG72_009691 [Tetrahymena utriculariae]